MKTKLTKIYWPKLLGSVLLSLGAGVIGSLFTVSAIPTWYATLTKPSFSPPNWLFGPVWTTLYILMGISFYIIFVSKKSEKQSRAKSIFIVQLILNALWSIIFFGLKSPITGFGVIIALLGSLMVTVIEFKKISMKAALLLLPYLIWVSFATLLNFAIVILN